ncbi:hypothetical protein BDR26DRAFT_873732 [Obelidium mucronatum]|nr:hypothetical protein BDR26DRAFT_873732 [Obelidium mucronatum]
MQEFSSVAVYVRRPLNSREDPNGSRLPAELAASLPPNAPTEHEYRRISSDTDYNLTIDVGPGSVEYIYGLLVVQPVPHIDYSNASITVLFAGVSKTEWSEGFIEQGQYKPFCEVENYILESHEILDTSPNPKLKALPFSITLRPRQDSCGLPISFESPSCSIYYFLRFKFYFPGTYRFAEEVTVPVTVVPPWTGAPPPNTPHLGPQEDGFRVVLDSSGVVRGSLNLIRGRSYHDTDLFLRPKVLSNLTSTEEPSRLAAIIRRSGRDSADSAMYRSSLEVDYEVPEYSPMEDGGERPSIAVERSQSTLDIADTSMDVAPLTFSALARRAHSEVPRSSSEPQAVPFQEFPNSPPLAYSMEDPLSFMDDLPTLSLDIPREGRNRPTPLIQEDSTQISDELITRPHYQELSAVAAPPQKAKPGLLKALFKRKAGRSTTSHQVPLPTAPCIPSTSTSSTETPVSTHLSIPSESPPRSSGLVNRQPSPSDCDPEPRTSSFDSLLSIIRTKSSPGTSHLQKPRLSVSKPPDVPRYRVIMPTTMFGPNSRVPIDLFIKSLPAGHRILQIQVRLAAVVTCVAYGNTKEDVKELSSADLKGGFDAFESSPDAVGNAVGGFQSARDEVGVFKKRVWLTVPDSVVMGQYATEFKVPLITLKHRVLFRLVTEKKRRVGKGFVKELFNLGGISVVLLR